MNVPPRLLTIAGSDSGGGAGIQADLKTFAAHGAYGMSVVTAVTAQNTVEVRRVHPVPADVVAAQIDAVFDDIGVDAVKVGMLGTAETIRAVAERLRHHVGETGAHAGNDGIPLVVDTVMVSKSGAKLIADDAVEALVEELLPLATVVTPNLPEAARLAGKDSVATEEERIAAGQVLFSRLGGKTCVLLKGGHGEGDQVTDFLVTDGHVTRFSHLRQKTSSTHGTGCTLSSAIAARMGRGDTLKEAISGSIRYLSGALATAYPLGSGHGPVDHLWRGEPVGEQTGQRR